MADDTKTDTKADAKADVKAEPKRVTRASAAKEKAAQDAQAHTEQILNQEPAYTVSYPSGISLFVPDKDTDEISVQVQGRQVWIDIENGFAHVPADATVTAATLEQSATFQRLASQGLLKRVIDPA